MLKIEAGESVLVVGSARTPWLEALLLAKGAESVVVILDRRGLPSRPHPKIRVLAPGNEQLDEDDFDPAVGLGSLQSLGLGRFGDGLHPWADLAAVAKAVCLGAEKFLVALPSTEDDEEDEIVFNSHRIYAQNGQRLNRMFPPNIWNESWSTLKTLSLLDDAEEDAYEATTPYKIALFINNRKSTL